MVDMLILVGLVLKQHLTFISAISGFFILVNYDVEKKIGIIGGVGPQATSEIYNRIIDFAQSKYGAVNNEDFPNIVIESVPVPDFISNDDKMEKALQMLAGAIRSLEMAGVTKLCIGSNTVHLLVPKLKKVSNVGFISLIQEITNLCARERLKRVGLIGSPMTINSGLYAKPLHQKNIKVIVPDKDELEFLNEVIRSVIAGNMNSVEKREYARIINRLLSSGAEKVILGCTELPLAINYEALGDKVISTTDVLAEKLVDYYYQN